MPFTYFNTLKENLNSALLCCVLAVAISTSTAIANNNPAPNYITQANQELVIKVQQWLLQELNQDAQIINASNFMISSTFIHEDFWKDTAYFPAVITKKAWYQNILDSFQVKEQADVKSTQNKTFSRIDVNFLFAEQSLANVFSNVIKFKLRKYIYLHLVEQNYYPQFISVNHQVDPSIVTQKDLPSSVQSETNENVMLAGSTWSLFQDDPINFILTWYELLAPLHQIFVLIFIAILGIALLWYLIRRNSKKKHLKNQSKKSKKDYPTYETIEQEINLETLDSDDVDASEEPNTLTLGKLKGAGATSTKTKKTQPTKQTQKATKTAPSNPAAPTPTQSTVPAAAPEILEKNSSKAPATELPKHKQDLHNKLIVSTAKHPYFLRKMYELWQQDSNKTSYYPPYLGDKAAMLYDILGAQIIQKMIPNIEAKHYNVLKEKALILNQSEIYWEEIQSQIIQDIDNLNQYLDNPDPYQTPFGFIKAMPDSAIISLLSSKALHIQSITLAQFDVARCQSLSLRISPTPEEHQKLSRQIERYRQYDGYFFQDVAGYLAYSLTQIVFKEQTVPIDSLAEQYSNEQSHAETKRALGDLQRQQNLGFNIANEKGEAQQSEQEAAPAPIVPTESTVQPNPLTLSSNSIQATPTFKEAHLTPQAQSNSVHNNVPTIAHTTVSLQNSEALPQSNQSFPFELALPSSTTEHSSLPNTDKEEALKHEWFDFGDKK